MNSNNLYQKETKFAYNVHKQFTKFIRPGAVRVDGISTNADILSLTFAHPVSKTMTVLLINKSSGALNTVIKAPNLPQKFGVTVVNSSGNYAGKDSIASSATVSLPANSITVLHGKNPSLVLATDYSTHVNFYQASVFPNPATETITIQASEAISGKASITDLVGRLVMNFDIDINQFGSFNVNLSGLDKGLYIITINGEKLFTAPIVKQ